MATFKGVIQGYAAQAAVDSRSQVIVAADAVGLGSEPSMLLPMIEQAAACREADTLITADAGWHSDAKVAQLKDMAIPAMIANNQMHQRDERFEGHPAQQPSHTLEPARAREGELAVASALHGAQHREAGQ